MAQSNRPRVFVPLHKKPPSASFVEEEPDEIKYISTIKPTFKRKLGDTNSSIPPAVSKPAPSSSRFKSILPAIAPRTDMGILELIRKAKENAAVKVVPVVDRPSSSSFEWSPHPATKSQQVSSSNNRFLSAVQSKPSAICLVDEDEDDVMEILDPKSKAATEVFNSTVMMSDRARRIFEFKQRRQQQKQIQSAQPIASNTHSSSRSSAPLPIRTESSQNPQERAPVILPRSNGINIPSNSSSSSVGESKTVVSAETLLDRESVLPAKRTRAVTDKTKVVSLDNHLYSDVLKRLEFTSDLEVSPDSMVNFVNLLTKGVYVNPIPSKPEDCAVSKPLSLDIGAPSMKKSMQVFPASVEYVDRFLRECKDYQIVNVHYRHLYPNEDVLTVKLVPCCNGDACMGVAGGIRAPGLREDDGTTFRGRRLPAFAAPDINMEIEHHLATGGMCILCILAAVANAVIIRRCQDRDFLLTREDPIVNFFNPVGVGQYHPLSVLSPQPDRPIGLPGPVLLWNPNWFYWEFNAERGCYVVNQRFYVLQSVDPVKLLREKQDQLKHSASDRSSHPSPAVKSSVSGLAIRKHDDGSLKK